MNESEPLMRCRESATICQKLQRYECSEEYNGNLFTGCMAGVIIPFGHELHFVLVQEA